MGEFLSFLSVIALWIGVSAFAWWVHQRRSGSRQQRRIALARQAADKVAGAQAVFDHVRRDLPSGLPVGDLAPQTHALLKRIQQRGDFFDAVNALRPQIGRVFGEECEALAEILHIRRDLWAASEIVLIEDFRTLGPDFADEEAYASLRGEAVHVLLPAAATVSAPHDLIDLRLSLARSEAERFVADVEEAVRLAREHERLPTASELIAYPVAAARALPGQARGARDQAVSFYGQVRAVAVTIRQSESVVKGLGELRRARAELPQRVVAGLGKTSAAARQSAAGLKGHYDFLVAAYDFQAKYEELVRKTPVLTDRGRQFIARLELAEKSERLKLTSATVRDAGRRIAVRGLAYLIAGLQNLQLALEKQLAAAGSAAAKKGDAMARSKGTTPKKRDSAAKNAKAAMPAPGAGNDADDAGTPKPITLGEPKEPALGTMHRLTAAQPKAPAATLRAHPLPRLTLKIADAPADAGSAPMAAPAASALTLPGENASAREAAAPAVATHADSNRLTLPSAPSAQGMKLTLPDMGEDAEENGLVARQLLDEGMQGNAAAPVQAKPAPAAAIAAEESGVPKLTLPAEAEAVEVKAPRKAARRASSRTAAQDTAPGAVKAEAAPVAEAPAASQGDTPKKTGGWRLFGSRKEPAEKPAAAPAMAVASPVSVKSRGRKSAKSGEAAASVQAETPSAPVAKTPILPEAAPAIIAEKAGPKKRSWFGGRSEAVKADSRPGTPSTPSEPLSIAAPSNTPDTSAAKAKASKPAKTDKRTAGSAAKPIVTAAAETLPPQKTAKRGWLGLLSKPAKVAAPAVDSATSTSGAAASSASAKPAGKTPAVPSPAVAPKNTKPPVPEGETPSRETPARRGWFGSRTRPAKDDVTTKAAAPARQDAPQPLSAKMKESVPPVTPPRLELAEPEIDVPAKPVRRGWFGAGTEPGKDRAAPTKQDGQQPLYAKLKQDAPPAKLELVTPPAAESEAPAKPARRGWFESRKQPAKQDASQPVSAQSAVAAKPGASAAMPAKLEFASPVKQKALPQPAPAQPETPKPAKAKKNAAVETPAKPEPSAPEAAAESRPPAKPARRGWFGRRTQPADVEPATQVVASPEPVPAQPDNPKPARAKRKAASVKADKTEAVAPRLAESDAATMPAAPAPAAESQASDKAGRDDWLGSRSEPAKSDDAAKSEETAKSLVFSGRPVEKPAASPGLPRDPLLAKVAAVKLPALKLVGDPEDETTPVESAAAPALSVPADAPAPSPARPAASLASKLTAAGSFDAAADEPDNTEEPDATTPDGEDDDPGPLTQTILESRARPEEKPGRGPSRAFPWLRR
jgi:hypothetical protein